MTLNLSMHLSLILICGEFSKEKSVVVDLNTLGKEVVDYHVGKNVLNKISNSCRKLVEYNFSYEAGRQ